MSGILYVVATPIGNLDDLTYRAVKTLQEVDFLAVEDTRVTVKLLNHLDIKKQMISYHEHNYATRGGQLIERILAGENCALCCDAGTPAISDPGQVLVQQAHEKGIRVVPIPGASAFVAALSAGGQETGRFVFEGFISVNKKQRQERLLALQKEDRTIVIYEAPHKLPSTLKDLTAAFGEGRPVTIARELTKIHEEIYMTTLGEASLFYEENKPKGEFVLLVAGTTETKTDTYSIEQATALAKLYLKEGQSTSSAAKQAAAETGFAKSEIYKYLLEEKE